MKQWCDALRTSSSGILGTGGIECSETILQSMRDRELGTDGRLARCRCEVGCLRRLAAGQLTGSVLLNKGLKKDRTGYLRRFEDGSICERSKKWLRKGRDDWL